MQVLVFQTNIATPHEVAKVADLFGLEPTIHRWTVDTEDADCMLRVVASCTLSETTVIAMIKDAGFMCSEMPD